MNCASPQPPLDSADEQLVAWFFVQSTYPSSANRMRESSSPQNRNLKVSIQLLDASTGRPMNSWRFDDSAEIRIGRLPDLDVPISDPYVSRHHASLVYRDGAWVLISFGRNGVLVSNQLIQEVALPEEQIFRLGVEGPTLRFSSSAESPNIGSTFQFTEEEANAFLLDEAQIENEVRDVIDGEYFLRLQNLAKDMRVQRKRE